MPESRVRLPAGVRAPYSVYVNGVLQEPGRDYRVEHDAVVFGRELTQEGRLGFWRWFWGAWGIGTYRKDDQVDVTWNAGGRPRVAHKLPIEPSDATPRRPPDRA